MNTFSYERYGSSMAPFILLLLRIIRRSESLRFQNVYATEEPRGDINEADVGTPCARFEVRNERQPDTDLPAST